MPASKLAVSVPVHTLSHPQHPAALLPPDSNADARHAPSNETHTAPEDWVSQVWYIGHLPGLPGQQALTFRELFLHSYALENIIVGMSTCIWVARCTEVPCKLGCDRSACPTTIVLANLCYHGYRS